MLWAPPPRRRQSPARSRRVVDCMSSSSPYSPPPPAPPSSPPAAVTVPACKLLPGNKRLRSGRAGASPPPSRRAARSPAARWKCWAAWQLSSPFPAPPRQAEQSRGEPRRAAPPRLGSPPGRLGALRGEQGEEGGGGAGARSGREGAAEGLEAEAPKEGLLRGSGRESPGSAAGLGGPRPPRPRPPHPPGGRESRAPPGRRESPAPRRQWAGSGTRASLGPRRANPLTKESPALLPLVQPPQPPRGSQPKGERTQKKRTHKRRPRRGATCRLWQGQLRVPSVGRVGDAARIPPGSSSATEGCPWSSNVTFRAPGRAPKYASLKPRG